MSLETCSEFQWVAADIEPRKEDSLQDDRRPA